MKMCTALKGLNDGYGVERYRAPNEWNINISVRGKKIFSTLGNAKGSDQRGIHLHPPSR
jgi:hypothetical protein